MLDTIDDSMDRCITDLINFLEEQPEQISPRDAGKIAALGLEYGQLADEGSGDIHLEPFFELLAHNPVLFRHITNEAFGQLLFQLPVTEEEGNPDSKINKKAALDVAEALGPDWAQAWYRFIVLVTKLA